MEFNARYAVTGLFALAVVAAMFGFVYWLKNTGGFGEQTQYQIRFTVPVSGLAIGSGVLFNGIKVGEVTRVSFDPQQPGTLISVISVMKQTPVRADTFVGVDYQGLTGAANILLTGGSPDSPALSMQNGIMPELAADPAASRSWTQNAGRVLGALDALLGRNTKRFDSILAGLERMSGGSATDEFTAYDLPLPQDFPPPLAQRSWQIAVSEPSLVLVFNTDKLLREAAGGAVDPIPGARWQDNLPNLVQARLIQSFENAGYASQVLRSDDAADPDYKLLLDIRRFQIVLSNAPKAEIEIVARIVSREGAVTASRSFQLSADVEGNAPASDANALGKAFRQMAGELVNWTIAAL